MKKNRLNTAVLLAVAALLLLASTVGSTQAALTYYSDNYSAEVTVSNIGVTLLENDVEISLRNYIGDKDKLWDETTGSLLTNMLSDDDDEDTDPEKLVLGKKYPERISVKNSGAIDSYVRVILRKSWQDENGVKNTVLSPDYIKINTLTSDGWVIDDNASKNETIVMYYTKVLPVGAETPDCTDTLSIDPEVGKELIKHVSADGKTVTYEYKYGEYTFNIEAEVDAVQTHNAKDAIKSAWGVDVTVAADGSISLN